MTISSKKVGGSSQTGAALLITGLPAAGKTTLGMALVEHLGKRAPYAVDRAAMRQQVTRYSSFVEIYLSTPLAECERRDPKGLYAKARAGQLHHMTGIDDPYEPPAKPELKLDGAQLSVEQLVERVTNYLGKKALL